MSRGSTARLVLLNGAPSSGKSTLAGRYAAAHPLTLALDIDVVRGMLGDWLNRPTEAGLAARAMALRMAHVHLSSGHDVLVPQFLGQIGFIVELEQLATTAGAEFIEVMLLSSTPDIARQFTERARRPTTRAQRDASALLELHGGIAELPTMCNRLLDVLAARPNTRIIRTTTGEPEAAYHDLLALLSQS
ncbi:AAA family ATPase [Pseudonocardia spinosispora]|uniref:AAA family ATPase n=1 Tax=Pseudonocardia spinosispora TaxID=103441 RepID=UPI00040EF6BD|nr:AAA family ATPase [Pseudonocardia spinosispora]